MKKTFLYVVFVVLVAGCQSHDPDENSQVADGIHLNLKPVFSDQKFNQPVAMLQTPTDNNSWYIVERAGRVYRAADIDSSNVELFADLTDRVDAHFPESGLLGMAFPPDFADNHYVYFSYTAPSEPLTSRLSRFSVSKDGKAVLKDSEKVILSIDNAYDKHNITEIAFGPDGFLYVGFGDGHEGGGDPLNNAQNTHTLMGAILRIDINKDDPYAIPSDNPFASGKEGKPEIYAWGFRNPWRWSFDSKTNDLWAADVGEYHWEEIDRIQKGANYGWPIREGKHCFGSRMDCLLKKLCLWNCPDANLTDPVVDYSHDEGCAAIGGYVYRGTAIPNLSGAYLFSDVCSATIWGLYAQGNGYERKILYTVEQEKREGGYLTVSFAQGNNGEVFVIYYNGGIYKIVGPS
jgi:glucose/arabinose dehydrogenase